MTPSTANPCSSFEHDLPPDNATGITKIVREIVHMPPLDEIKSIEDMP